MENREERGEENERLLNSIGTKTQDRKSENDRKSNQVIKSSSSEELDKTYFDVNE